MIQWPLYLYLTVRDGSFDTKILILFTTYAFAYDNSIENSLQCDRILFSYHAFSTTILKITHGMIRSLFSFLSQRYASDGMPWGPHQLGAFFSGKYDIRLVAHLRLVDKFDLLNGQ